MSCICVIMWQMCSICVDVCGCLRCPTVLTWLPVMWPPLSQTGATWAGGHAAQLGHKRRPPGGCHRVSVLHLHQPLPGRRAEHPCRRQPRGTAQDHQHQLQGPRVGLPYHTPISNIWDALKWKTFCGPLSHCMLVLDEIWPLFDIYILARTVRVIMMAN